MAKIVLSEFITLDGVMADPGGAEGNERGGWAFKFERGPEGDQFKLDELFAADAMLLGRKTYAGFAQAWPSMTDDVGFAERMNGMRKYVVSSTLTDEEASWTNTVVLRGDLVKHVEELRAQPGGDVLIAGSGQLAAALIAEGLIDEYRLMVYPVVLGEGQRLFPESGALTSLVLDECSTCGEGIQMLVYHPKR